MNTNTPNTETQQKPVFTQKKYFNKNFNKNKHKNPNNGPATKNTPKVKITFLGGIGEIGKNLTVFETEQTAIVLDCGMAFPDNELPGVEVIVPDISYLLSRKDKIKAFIITHAHEDHIGALPHTLGDIKAPIYASKFSLGMIDNKMREYPKIKYKAVEVKPRSILKIDDFTLEFIHTNHSIIGALAVAIKTPAGTIFHTGDFKIDEAPVDGKTIDKKRIAEIGARGVQLLMCDTTNATSKGHSLSETNVGKVLEEEVFQKYAENRLIISTFASNVHRMQQILTLAEKYGRKIAFTGRSMINVSEVANRLGELKLNKENIITIDALKKYADKEVLILSTGSQGEPLSALTRMANDNFAKFKLTTNDVVVFSSSPIPGNEKSIINVMNKLIKKGVEVVHDKLAPVHASGHACQEELVEMFNLTKPKFIIPVHGEPVHLKECQKLAINHGYNARQVPIVDLGYQMELTPTSLKRVGLVKAGSRLVDGTAYGDLESPVIRDRKQLADDGFLIAVINISTKTSKLVNDPLIITRGFLYGNEMDKVITTIKTNLLVFIKSYDFKASDTNTIKNDMRKFLSNIIHRKTKRKPIVLCTTIFS